MHSFSVTAVVRVSLRSNVHCVPIKCHLWKQLIELELSALVNYLKLKLKCDHSYYYQCQLQMFVTKRDIVVWSLVELHIEYITIDETLIQSAIPIAEKFWRLCVLPELLGKWYTRRQAHNVQSDCIETEEDSGTWCYCREDKGGEMIACDSKVTCIKWFHLDCVGMSASTVPQGKWLCTTCHSSEHKTSHQVTFKFIKILL